MTKLRIVIAALVFTATALLFSFPSRHAAVLRYYLGDGALLAVGVTTGALFTIGAVLLLTFLGGRFYCSMICPFGILQELLARLTRFRRRASLPAKNYRRARYAILIVVGLLLLAGAALPLRYLAPSALFGKIAAAFFNPALVGIYNYFYPNSPLPTNLLTLALIIPAAIIAAGIIALVVWKARIFCTTVCPFGTLLGLIAKRGIFGLKIQSTCRDCGNCQKICPAGCIDGKNKIIDDERCLRCWRCVPRCKFQAITLARRRATPVSPPVLPLASRRALGYAAILAVTGGALNFLHRRYRWHWYEKSQRLLKKNPLPILPPGAGSAPRLAARCIACNLCVTQCVGRVLRPADSKHDTVHLEFADGMCEFNCHRCGRVCPTGAIEPLELEDKQCRRIGQVALDPELCVAIQMRQDCGACAEHCPTHAVIMEEHDGMRIPVLQPEFCIGCGACEYACPVQPVRAIISAPIDVQVVAEIDTGAPQESAIDGDWLF